MVSYRHTTQGVNPRSLLISIPPFFPSFSAIAFHPNLRSDEFSFNPHRSLDFTPIIYQCKMFSENP